MTALPWRRGCGVRVDRPSGGRFVIISPLRFLLLPSPGLQGIPSPRSVDAAAPPPNRRPPDPPATDWVFGLHAACLRPPNRTHEANDIPNKCRACFFVRPNTFLKHLFESSIGISRDGTTVRQGRRQRQQTGRFIRTHPPPQHTIHLPLSVIGLISKASKATLPTHKNTGAPPPHPPPSLSLRPAAGGIAGLIERIHVWKFSRDEFAQSYL